MIEHLKLNKADVAKRVQYVSPLLQPGRLHFEQRTTWYTYHVRSGDNLSTIAQNHGCSVRDLHRWNKLAESSLKVNQRLSIRVTERVAVIDRTPRATYDSRVLQSLLAQPMPSPPLGQPDTDSDDTPSAMMPPENPVVLRRRMSVQSAFMLQRPNTDIERASEVTAVVSQSQVLSGR